MISAIIETSLEPIGLLSGLTAEELEAVHREVTFKEYRAES